MVNPDWVQRGALLFMDPRLSGDGSRSCATCHPGGASTGAFYAQGVEVEAGNPAGRRVPPLRGLYQTAPYFWDGSRPTVEAAVQSMLDLEMRAGRLEAVDLGALVAYVQSIPPYDNGRIQLDGAPVEPATLSTRRGSEVFKGHGCADCHRPPAFSNGKVYDVGTDGRWSVPSLRGVSEYPRLAHDGRWKDLETAVQTKLTTLEVELTNQELNQLLRYLELL